MKKLATLILLTLAMSAASFANAVTYAGSNGTMSGYVTYAWAGPGNPLMVDVFNTGTGSIDQVTFLGPQLTPSALQAGWAYAYGPVAFSRFSSLTTLTVPIGSGSGAWFVFDVPAGFTLADVGNPTTNDGTRLDYWGTPAYVEGYLQATPEPTSLMLLGTGALGLASWMRRKRRNL